MERIKTTGNFPPYNSSPFKKYVGKPVLVLVDYSEGIVKQTREPKKAYKGRVINPDTRTQPLEELDKLP